MASNNPYLTVSPAPASQFRPVGRICDALKGYGKKVEDVTKQAENFAGDVRQHIKLSPNLKDAALAKLTQCKKLVVEGGHERQFNQTFQSMPGEKLVDAFACHLSSATEPVIGTLYISNKRIAFCSDYPLCSRPSPGHEEYVHYKVVLNLHQLATVTPTVNKFNNSEKYILVRTVDGFEFSFTGFLMYDSALKALNDAVQRGGATH